MNQHPGIFGRKLGCVQLFTEQGDVQRTTVIEAAGLTVLGKRTKERDGYVALVFGLEDRKTKHTKKAVAGQYQDSADKKSFYKDAALQDAAREGFDVFCEEARAVLGEWFDRWPVTAHMAWHEGVQAIRVDRQKR